MDVSDTREDELVTDWVDYVVYDNQVIPPNTRQGYLEEKVLFLGIYYQCALGGKITRSEATKRLSRDIYTKLGVEQDDSHPGKPGDHEIIDNNNQSILKGMMVASKSTKAPDVEKSTSVLHIAKELHKLVPATPAMDPLDIDQVEWESGAIDTLSRSLRKAACLVAQYLLQSTKGVTKVLPVVIGADLKSKSEGGQRKGPASTLPPRHALYIESNFQEPVIIPLAINLP